MTRDEKGRFLPGTSGNPKGRQKRQTEDKYISVLLKVVTIPEWRKVIEKALYDAKRGDNAARKFLADYIVGPPVERKVVTGADGGRITLEVIYGDRKHSE